jgi:hypothetical protein
LVEHFHGKEGVAGSSPAEGSLEFPGISLGVVHFRDRQGNMRGTSVS